MGLFAFQPFGIARILVTVTGGLGLLWLTLATTLSWSFSSFVPELGARLWPNAQVRANQGWALLGNGQGASEPSLSAAEQLAKAAVRQELINVAAVRNLGLVAATRGDQAKAGELFRAAERLSRRDVPTQMWLIEDHVQRGDVRGALTHYDLAMRSSREAQLMLLPKLAQAAQSLAVARPLSQLAATRPVWWLAFADQLLTDASATEAVSLIIAEMKLDPDKEEERERLTRAIDKLIGLRDYPRAFSLYRQARAGSPASTVRNGDFSFADNLSPFEWQLQEDTDLGASIEQRDGAVGPALTLHASEGRSGAVAQQMITLKPGAYQLQLRTGALDQSSATPPEVAIVCVDTVSPLAASKLQASGARSVMDLTFIVPAGGCKAQWLKFSVSAALDDGSASPWVDSVSIRSR